GNGDGTFQNAQIYTFDGWMLGTTLGDLDGDGSLDWVNSNYGAGHWHVMHNDGTGHFNQSQRIEAPANASCATLFDFDNDGTLDMVLADETSDIVLIERNDGSSGSDIADVSVGMSAAPNQYTAGETLSYTITVTNTGPDASPATHVADNFPASLEGVTWTCAPSGGADCATSGNGDLDEDVSIPSGGQVVYTVEGTVAAGTTGTINNTATAIVGAPASDPDTSDNSVTTHTNAAGLEADVAVSLSANPTQYTAGDPLTYTITVTNAGPDAAENTHVADDFPTAFTGASWSCVGSGGATCASSGSGNLDEDVSIPAGGQVVFNVNGTVAANATGQLVNTVTATVGAPADDPDTSNNTATLHTNPGNLPDEIFAGGFDGG
ncbi:MAG TPA: FG-GAP-like repeat-containing protein, partial [Rhodanobacteraceae bacterium]|nr:FG-GAP-like repeat-containing protein [Rhodanobacteraceae bacterium]